MQAVCEQRQCEKVYIHYGHSKFDPDAFEDVKNRSRVKPDGGFWASSIDAKFGWKYWCKVERFEISKLELSFKFKLMDNSRILTIDSLDILRELPSLESPRVRGLMDDSIAGILENRVYLDFEKLTDEYDAIEVLISNDRRLYYALYGWDCDSILVLNKDVVIPL